MPEYIPSSELKTIIHSKRANLYYLEHCRILVKDGRVEYVTDEGKASLYWNIPIANTTCLLLGSGTSITQAAVRELSKAGVMIGFSSGDGTPLYAGTEIEWLNPQSEYRPTQYLQNWCAFWFDDEKRLNAAKTLQNHRLDNLLKYWQKFDWEIHPQILKKLVEDYALEFKLAKDNQHLLSIEASLTKKLYSLAANACGETDFKRIQGGNTQNSCNQFLDQGNYLAYGLGATACWVLGLPHGLAILHGKTRRGGLVFDTADIIKDAIILPQAFISASQGDHARQFRQACINNFSNYQALDIMIDTLKAIAQP